MNGNNVYLSAAAVAPSDAVDLPRKPTQAFW
jgi:hypothetical protein